MKNGFCTLRLAETAEATPAPLGEPETAQRSSILGRWRTRPPGKPPLLLSGEENPRAEEQYRLIRTKLLHNPRHPALIVISSPGEGDGKTLTAIHLAATFALRTEESVLLVDGDLRRPGVHRYLGLPPGPGLAELLQDEVPLEDALCRLEETPGLGVLPAGERHANPAELLASSRWPRLAAMLRERFRHVFIDSPPFAGLADGELIGAVSDGVLLVIRQDHTDRTACLEALRTLSPQLLGVVWNSAVDWFLWKPPRAYYYYRNDPERKGGSRR